MRNTETADDLSPIPIQFKGTPITDETFLKQGWVQINETEGDFEDYDDIDFEEDIEGLFSDDDSEHDIFFDMEPKYPNMGEWEDEYYFWILKVPKYWPNDNCLTFISTTSDHHLPGMEKGQYIVELYNQYGLGTCQTEEELELLYKMLTGENIYE